MRKDQAIIPTLATRYGNADVKPIAVVERPRCFRICGNHSVTPSTPTIRQKYENVRPSAQAGSPSHRSSQRQPARPPTPFILSSAADTGPLMTDDIGLATLNQAKTRARTSTGNHVDR